MLHTHRVMLPCLCVTQCVCSTSSLLGYKQSDDTEYTTEYTTMAGYCWRIEPALGVTLQKEKKL